MKEEITDNTKDDPQLWEVVGESALNRHAEEDCDCIFTDACITRYPARTVIAAVYYHAHGFEIKVRDFNEVMKVYKAERLAVEMAQKAWPGVKKVYTDCQGLLGRYENIAWIPRRHNRLADRLTHWRGMKKRPL